MLSCPSSDAAIYCTTALAMTAEKFSSDHNLTDFCKSCTVLPFVEDVMSKLLLKAPGFARLSCVALPLLPAGATAHVDNEKMSSGRYDEAPVDSKREQFCT